MRAGDEGEMTISAHWPQRGIVSFWLANTSTREFKEIIDLPSASEHNYTSVWCPASKYAAHCARCRDDEFHKYLQCESIGGDDATGSATTRRQTTGPAGQGRFSDILVRAH